MVIPPNLEGILEFRDVGFVDLWLINTVDKYGNQRRNVIKSNAIEFKHVIYKVTTYSLKFI